MDNFRKNRLKKFGFKKEIENVEKNLCPFCGSDKTKRENFKDELSWREYNMSGLCQVCMDEIFN